MSARVWAAPSHCAIRKGCSEARSQPQKDANTTPTTLRLPLGTSCRCPALSRILPPLVSNMACCLLLPCLHVLLPLPGMASACPSAKLIQDSGQSSVKAEVLHSQNPGLCLWAHCWGSGNITSPYLLRRLPLHHPPPMASCSCIFVGQVYPLDCEGQKAFLNSHCQAQCMVHSSRCSKTIKSLNHILF